MSFTTSAAAAPSRTPSAASRKSKTPSPTTSMSKPGPSTPQRQLLATTRWQSSFPPSNISHISKGSDTEEDDYMTMYIAELNSQRAHETSIQRAARLKKEREARATQPSKTERELKEEVAREEALRTKLDESNKGYKMLEKLGYKQGQALGKQGGDGEGRREPIAVEMKEGRSGIGMESEKKRKFREEAERVEEGVKKQKAEEGEFRERVRREREERRWEGQLAAAQKVAERLDVEGKTKEVKEVGEKGDESEAAEPKEEKGKDAAQSSEKKDEHKPLKSVPVLYRGLVRQRLEAEREKRMRYDLHQSLSRLPTYDDPDEDADYKQALGKENSQIYEEELEEEDAELDEFNALPVEERLEKLVLYLRDTYYYCFWCKFQYPDEEMDGCPGVTEEDHD